MYAPLLLSSNYTLRGALLTKCSNLVVEAAEVPLKPVVLLVESAAILVEEIIKFIQPIVVVSIVVIQAEEIALWTIEINLLHHQLRLVIKLVHATIAILGIEPVKVVLSIERFVIVVIVMLIRIVSVILLKFKE